jgi:hypothetical protein
MKTKSNVSVNILRDKNRELIYYPTPNAIRVVDDIFTFFKNGNRSFSIIGSYGTGKSSFLLALQKTLNKEKKYFKLKDTTDYKVEFINIVGEAKSIKDAFAEYFDLNNKKVNTNDILNEIYSKYHSLGKKNPLLVISIDEFGKFLEYAANNKPEEELYFVQQLAEFANNTDHNIILLTTIHQNFDAYAVELKNSQKQEWTKVKGRFKEVTFNEPIEQLLFLASEKLANEEKAIISKKQLTESISLLKNINIFSLSDEFAMEVGKNLYPIDLISAGTIALCIQRYGQNERSLFSFLEATDKRSIQYHIENKPKQIYNLESVYDFLVNEFYSYINSKFNVDYTGWSSLFRAIDSVENQIEKDVEIYISIIKVIGLLNIVGKQSSDLNKKNINIYLSNYLNIDNPELYINQLELKKIIRYQNYNNRYVPYEGTDVDINLELIKVANEIEEIVDIATMLQKNYDLPPIVAKKETFEKGAPRLFEYRISSEPIFETAKNEIDGFINLIFNPKIKKEEIIKKSENNNQAILYGYYKNSKNIKDLLTEIEKANKAMEQNIDDKVAYKEFRNIAIRYQTILNHKILNNYFSKQKEVIWIFNGEEVTINSKREFNSQLSKICQIVYNKAPHFNNELVNKHKISASINTAKNAYFNALINNWDKTDLGFHYDKYPPEKTIFLTLLKNNDINFVTSSSGTNYNISETNSFNYLWKESVDFLQNAKSNRRNISDLIDILSKEPFKLKKGLLEFWIPTFLFLTRDDFALFQDDIFMANITEEVLVLISKKPEGFSIKSFDIQGPKLDIFNCYRDYFGLDKKTKGSKSSFIETVKPFLTFYRDLPLYAKQTQRLSANTLMLRDYIAKSKEPEKLLFQELPTAFGYKETDFSKPTTITEYTNLIKSSIKELRSCYDDLINRFETFLLDEYLEEGLDFEIYQQKFQARYKHLRRHLLFQNQKSFVQRIDSQIDDKKAWLNSFVFGVIGNTLEKLTDEQEKVLYDKTKSIISEIDSLNTLSKEDFDEKTEKVFNLKLDTFNQHTKDRTIRIPQNKSKKIIDTEKNVKKHLSSDKITDIAVLINLLNELLDD